jgi:hypothetical protein
MGSSPQSRRVLARLLERRTIMRVFGYLEATKYGQYGVLEGLQRCCHLELTRKVNRRRRNQNGFLTA